MTSDEIQTDTPIEIFSPPGSTARERELLHKVSRLQERVDELEQELRARDLELRDGLLLIVRGVEKRQRIGKYS